MPETNPILQSLYARKSVRVFEEKAIPAGMKQAILEAAAQAPSAGCQQLYTILDITDPALKAALADSCDHQPFIAKAPLVLVFCAAYAVQRFDAMRLKRSDWNLDRFLVLQHLKIGFPMGFQMSVMCIGQMAMQAAVNAIGTNAVAGYTAATKVDQMSVLVNNAFGVTLSTYVAQNYGAGKIDRIKRGFNACFLMTECANLLMGALILLIEPVIVPLFVDSPVKAASTNDKTTNLTPTNLALLKRIMLSFISS